MRGLRAILFALLLLFPACAGAERIECTAPSCRVSVNGEEIAVYETAVSHQRFWSENPALSTTPVAIATADGKIDVEVEFFGEAVSSAVVRPLSLGIEPEIADGRVRFALDGPGHVTVEYNGQAAGALHLFLDARDEDRPDADAPGVQYFGPGVYTDVIITPRRGQTVYIDEGAIVYGQIFCGMGSDFTIAGHGILCGSIYDRYDDAIVPVNIKNAKHFTLRDITILDPSAWTINLYACEDVTIENVKIVGARSNSDGISIQNCENVRVRNCFVRSWDDSLVVKGYHGDVRDIAFEDCVLWTDLAQSCEIGYETRAKVIEDIAFRNITVLHNFHKPVISIHNSDDAAVRNVTFEHIVVEDAQMGMGDGAPYLIELTTTESQWSATLRRGTIDGVEIRDVSVLSGQRPGIRIWSQDEQSRIDHVQISGLRILGETIGSLDQLAVEASPYNGPDISLTE